MSGDLSPLILRAHKRIAEQYSETSIARLIETGQINSVIEEAFNEAVLNAAYAPVRERMRSGVTDTMKYVSKYELPRRGTIEFAFDSLSPNVITGIRELESKVITNMQSDVREVARAYVESGLRDGINPRTISRSLRSVIGLAPNQELAVSNFRKSLEEGDVSKALGYKLRDKRLKVTDSLTTEQIDKATDAYRKKMIAFNAETNARTAALDSQKLAQKLSWEQAINQGIVDGDRLRKKWVGVKDDRERDEHLAMEGETVPFNARYSNGEDVPGDSTYNCRCVSQVFLARPVP